MSNESSSKVNADKLGTAFDMVNPALRAKAIAEVYGLDSYSKHWKDPIRAVVTDCELAAAGLTIGDVEAAIIHYTATVAKVTRETAIKSTTFVTFVEPVGGYTVFADGYRMGPAGDH